jgi:hypothetical protein
MAAVGTFAVACNDSATGPELEAAFDTEAAIADYEALDAALGSGEFASFMALGARTPFGASPAAIDVVAALKAPDAADGGRSFALNLARRIQAVGPATGPAAAPIISDRHRGVTFVYDPATDDYAADPERTGAPETGVRFITYEVDETGTPIVEQETGYADLVDEGDGSTEDIVLHLTVVQDGSTVLDYRTTLDQNENRGALTVEGFLQGDGVRLDFAIDAVGTESEGQTMLDIAFELRVDARDFRITGNVSGIEEGTEGEGDIDVTVRHGTNSIRVDVTGSDGMMEGTFFLNGDIFATVSGPAEELTILGQGGEPLTFGETLVLHRIVDAIEDVFDFSSAHSGTRRLGDHDVSRLIKDDLVSARRE